MAVIRSKLGGRAQQPPPGTATEPRPHRPRVQRCLRGLADGLAIGKVLNPSMRICLILGMAGNDTITDTSGVDDLRGGIGDDTITVSGGDFFRFDKVVGGSDNDTIRMTGTKIIAEGNGDNDTFHTIFRATSS